LVEFTFNGKYSDSTGSHGSLINYCEIGRRIGIGGTNYFLITVEQLQWAGLKIATSTYF